MYEYFQRSRYNYVNDVNRMKDNIKSPYYMDKADKYTYDNYMKADYDNKYKENIKADYDNKYKDDYDSKYKENIKADYDNKYKTDYDNKYKADYDNKYKENIKADYDKKYSYNSQCDYDNKDYVKYTYHDKKTENVNESGYNEMNHHKPNHDMDNYERKIDNTYKENEKKYEENVNYKDKKIYSDSKYSTQFNIPYTPILKTDKFSEIIDMIYDAIVDEATAAEFYSRLLKEAPDELHKEFIEHAMEDELEHLEAFKKLYEFFTCQKATYKIEPVKYPSYKKGLEMALKDELEAAEFYRDVILKTDDKLTRDTMFFALVDELEHATQFGVLYNTIDKYK